jgi:hypothetical protein
MRLGGLMVLVTLGFAANVPADAPPPVAVKLLGLFNQLRAAEAQKAHGNTRTLPSGYPTRSSTTT